MLFIKMLITNFFYNCRSRYEEDTRNKKGPPSRPDQQQRGADYGAKQFSSNLPPRLLRQQQQHNSQPPYSSNQRRSPSPPASGL